MFDHLWCHMATASLSLVLLVSSLMAQELRKYLKSERAERRADVESWLTQLESGQSDGAAPNP